MGHGWTAGSAVLIRVSGGRVARAANTTTVHSSSSKLRCCSPLPCCPSGFCVSNINPTFGQFKLRRNDGLEKQRRAAMLDNSVHRSAYRASPPPPPGLKVPLILTTPLFADKSKNRNKNVRYKMTSCFLAIVPLRFPIVGLTRATNCLNTKRPKVIPYTKGKVGVQWPRSI